MGIVSSTTLVAGKSYLQGVRHLIRRMGVRFPLHRGIELALARLAQCYLRCTARTPWVRSIGGMAAEYGIPMARVRDVNGRESLALLREWDPELVICVYVHQVFKKPLIRIPARGVINVHPSMLPQNGGPVPCIWVLASGDRSTGVTVHWMDEQLDTGDIILQREIEITDSDTWFSLEFRCAQAGGELLVEAVTQIAAGTDSRTGQEGREGSYASWPTRECLQTLRKRGRKLVNVAEMWRHFTRVK